MLMKNNMTRSVSPKLIDMIWNDQITPAFISSGFFKYFAIKAFGDKMEGVAGFYIPNKDKIFILVDTNSNIFNYTSDDVLSYTVVHECMHMAATRKSNDFWNTFKGDLVDFYNFVFSGALGIEAGVKFDSLPLVEYMWKNMELKADKMNKRDIEGFGDLLRSYKSKSYFNPDAFQDRVEKIQFIYIANFWNEDVIDQMYSRRDYRELFVLLYQAYQKVFGIRATRFTYAYQEFGIPSEVICIAAAKPGPKFYSVIKRL